MSGNVEVDFPPNNSISPGFLSLATPSKPKSMENGKKMKNKVEWSSKQRQNGNGFVFDQHQPGPVKRTSSIESYFFSGTLQGQRSNFQETKNWKPKDVDLSRRASSQTAAALNSVATLITLADSPFGGIKKRQKMKSLKFKKINFSHFTKHGEDGMSPVLAPEGLFERHPKEETSNLKKKSSFSGSEDASPFELEFRPFDNSIESTRSKDFSSFSKRTFSDHSMQNMSRFILPRIPMQQQPQQQEEKIHPYAASNEETDPLGSEEHQDEDTFSVDSFVSPRLKPNRYQSNSNLLSSASRYFRGEQIDTSSSNSYSQRIREDCQQNSNPCAGASDQIFSYQPIESSSKDIEISISGKENREKNHQTTIDTSSSKAIPMSERTKLPLTSLMLDRVNAEDIGDEEDEIDWGKVINNSKANNPWGKIVSPKDDLTKAREINKPSSKSPRNSASWKTKPERTNQSLRSSNSFDSSIGHNTSTRHCIGLLRNDTHKLKIVSFLFTKRNCAIFFK